MSEGVIGTEGWSHRLGWADCLHLRLNEMATPWFTAVLTLPVLDLGRSLDWAFRKEEVGPKVQEEKEEVRGGWCIA